MGIENQYLGNPNLKKAFVSQEFTKENILEFQKCMNDPQYFIEKYIKGDKFIIYQLISTEERDYKPKKTVVTETNKNCVLTFE